MDIWTIVGACCIILTLFTTLYGLIMKQVDKKVKVFEDKYLRILKSFGGDLAMANATLTAFAKTLFNGDQTKKDNFKKELENEIKITLAKQELEKHEL